MVRRHENFDLRAIRKALQATLEKIKAQKKYSPSIKARLFNFWQRPEKVLVGIDADDHNAIFNWAYKHCKPTGHAVTLFLREFVKDKLKEFGSFKNQRPAATDNQSMRYHVVKRLKLGRWEKEFLRRERAKWDDASPNPPNPPMPPAFAA